MALWLCLYTHIQRRYAKAHTEVHIDTYSYVDADTCCHTNAVLHIDTYTDNKHINEYYKQENISWVKLSVP